MSGGKETPTEPLSSEALADLRAKWKHGVYRVQDHSGVEHIDLNAAGTEAYGAIPALLDLLQAERDENERLTPKPNAYDHLTSAVYRDGPITPELYDEAIEDLQNARRALIEGDHMGCRVCEDSGHGANMCHHNPLLLARKWAAATRIWQCWHCGFIATNDEEGRAHFGEHDGELPSCERTTLLDQLAASEAHNRALRKALEQITRVRPPPARDVNTDQEIVDALALVYRCGNIAARALSTTPAPAPDEGWREWTSRLANALHNAATELHQRNSEQADDFALIATQAFGALASQESDR